MQTQPREAAPPPEAAPQPKSNKIPDWLKRPNWPRLVSVALAFSGLALYFVYITKGADFYRSFPGGRKLLFGLAGLAFGGLTLARLYLALGLNWLSAWLGQVRVRAGLREGLPVALVVGLALAVRLWGVNFGLPYLEQVDEWNVAERALHIIQTGDFDPLDYHHPGLADNDRQAFTYPTLYTYLQTAAFAVRFLQGVVAGNYDGTNSLNSPLVKADFYDWGRGLTALLGAGTVLVVFIIGRRYYGQRVGLIAALFLAFFYLHALNSHWITTDVPSSFFALLPFWWIYGIGTGDAWRRSYLLAGLFCGLAVGSKYNNLLIVLPLVLAHLTAHPWRRWLNPNLLIALAAIVGGFFVSSPFIFFHLPQFFTDLAAIINHYQNQGHPGFEGSDNWRYYIGALWADNAAVVGLGLIGVGLAFVRHRRQDIILLSFPICAYVQLAGYKVNFTRNLMPLLPFLTIFGAWTLVVLVEWVGRRLKRFRWEVPTLTLLALLSVVSPALAIVNYDRYNAQPTNRARATAWVEQNLPHGAKFWIEPFSVELLPRNAYRVEGGKGALEHPPEWYAANGFNYLVLSEAYYKEALDTGKPSVQAAYRALLDGPRPVGWQLVQDFPRNNTDQPGARVLILSTGLPTVAASPGEYAISHPLQFDFGGKIRLAGTDLAANAKAGTILPVILYWQSFVVVPQDYTVFLHLLDATGKIVAQLDLSPLGNTRPTSTWKSGEVVRDEYPLPLSANLAPGEYRLVVGLYLAPNGARLSLSSTRDEAEVGRVRLEQ